MTALDWPIISSPVLDAMPELYHDEERGWEVSGACRDGPLPQCKYDDPAWFQRNRRLARDFKIWSAMQQDDLTVEDAAERFSVTVRTIFRIMRRCRDATLINQEELVVFAGD